MVRSADRVEAIVCLFGRLEPTDRHAELGSRAPGRGPDSRDSSRLAVMDWEVNTRDIHGDATFNLADLMPELWGKIDVPLWQLDVVQAAGTQGEDVVNALLAGGNARAQADVTQALKPYRVRVRPVPFQDLRRRVAVGLERPEQRVLIRSAVQQGRYVLGRPVPGGSPILAWLHPLKGWSRQKSPGGST